MQLIGHQSEICAQMWPITEHIHTHTHMGINACRRLFPSILVSGKEDQKSSQTDFGLQLTAVRLSILEQIVETESEILN